MKTAEADTTFTWATWAQRSTRDAIEIVPLSPWEPSASEAEAKGGIYVLRRRYLRSEQEVESSFLALVSVWERDTLLVSSPREAAMHESYQKIIGLGLQCVPLLLQRLHDTRRNYFWALGAITHRNPAEGMDTIGEAIAAWLSWGRAEGYIDS